jgi:hypothetical protein
MGERCRDREVNERNQTLVGDKGGLTERCGIVQTEEGGDR